MPLQAAPGATRHVLPGGAVALVHPDRRRIFVYNRTAHLLLRALTRCHRSRLPFALASRFGVPLDVAQRDVDSIFAECTASGLLNETKTRDHAPLASGLGDRGDASGFKDQLGLSRFRIGPLVVEVRASAAIERAIAPLWQHLRDDSTSADTQFILQVGNDGLGRLVNDGRIRIDGAEPHLLVGALCQAILERLHPATRWGPMIHGGAVAREGKAIVITAPSGFGKSTLIAYLVARGFEFLSDDLVPLRAQDHVVMPFPLPISVKPGAAGALAPFYSSLDADAPRENQFLIQHASFMAPGRPVEALIFPRYTPGATTSFENVSVEDALLRLLSDRIYFGLPIADQILSGFIRFLRRIERRSLIYSRFEEVEDCLAQL